MIKFRRSLSLIVLLLFVLQLTGQELNLSYHIATVPDSLKENARSIVMQYNADYKVINDKQATMSVFRVVTLLKGGSGENELVLHYDKDTKISKFNISIYDANGVKVRDVQKNEINDFMAVGGGQFYTDSRVKHVTVDYPSYPYTIAYSYEMKYAGFGIVSFPKYFPQSFEQSVLMSSFTADLPEDNELFYDLNQMDAPATASVSGRRRYRWNVEGLKAKEPESFGPAYAKALPNVRTVLGRFEIISGVKSTFKSWDSFGQMMNRLIAGRDELPPELAQEVKQTVSGITEDRAKIAALYKFMQDRVRYVGVQLGIGGWQPFSAEYVEKNRYGDCKALSNYMMAMLDEVGIDAYPTLIYAGNTYYPIKEDFPTSAFNHMILYVPSEDMYLECTSNYLPPGYLNEHTLDRHVLWVTPEGGKLARTPEVNPVDHGHLRTQHLELLDNGSAKLKIKTRYVGADHEALRYFSRTLPKKELKEYLQENDHIPDVSGQHFELKAAEEAPFVDLLYETELPRYARKMGKRFFVPLNKLFPFDVRPEATESREFEVVNKAGRFLVDTVYISLPEGLSLEAKGKPIVDINHAAGDYHSELTTVGTQLQWVRTLKIHPVALPPAEYDAFRDFFLAVGKADRQQLVFKSVTR